MMIIDHLCFFSSPPFLLDSDQYNFWSSNEQRSGGPAISCNQRKISLIFWQKSKNLFGQQAGWCHGTALCIFFWLLLDLATLSSHQIQKPKKMAETTFHSRKNGWKVHKLGQNLFGMYENKGQVAIAKIIWFIFPTWLFLLLLFRFLS